MAAKPKSIFGFEGPLADRYWAAVALVVLALTPFLVLTAAVSPLTRTLADGTGLSPEALELTAAMANAAYCFGTVASVQLIQLLPGRRMLLAFSALFVVSSVLAAWAPVPGLFVAGRVGQGLATSLMLIAAAPSLITGWPTPKLRFTAVTMNLGIFGAVALGPVVGNLFAEWQSWRPLFWIVAALGAAALGFILLTFEDQPPQDPEAPLDLVSLGLAASGCGLAFFGVSELSRHSATHILVLLPGLLGVGLLAALIAHQFFVSDPLIPVRRLAHTVPTAAILTAMAAGAGSVALIDLAGASLELGEVSPGTSALLYLPEFGGAMVTAALFGAIYFTRWTWHLAFGGMVALAGAGAVLSGAASGSQALIAVGVGGVGVGVGASVAPALFITGFSLPSRQLPRIFAIIELLRGVAAFLTAPLLLYAAESIGSPGAGIESAVWMATAIVLAGILVSVGLVLLGGARPQAPDVERWLSGEGPAIHSPGMAERARAKRRRRRFGADRSGAPGRDDGESRSQPERSIDVR